MSHEKISCNVAENGGGTYRLLAILRWAMVVIFVSFGMQKFTLQSAQGIVQYCRNLFSDHALPRTGRTYAFEAHHTSRSSGPEHALEPRRVCLLGPYRAQAGYDHKKRNGSASIFSSEVLQ